MPVSVRDKIVLFGDSLTERGFSVEFGGWASHLANHFVRRLDVVNHGYGGYTSVWADALFDSLFQEKHVQGPVRLAVVFFGANDAANNERQKTSLADYEKSLASIVAKFRSLPDGLRPKHIVLLAPPVVDDAVWNGSDPSRQNDRDNAKAGEYAAACERVAAGLGVPCVNLHRIMLSHADWRGFMEPDGLHLGSKGNRLVFDQLLAVIHEQFLDMRLDDAGTAGGLTMAAPHHSQVFFMDPRRSFQ